MIPSSEYSEIPYLVLLVFIFARVLDPDKPRLEPSVIIRPLLQSQGHNQSIPMHLNKHQDQLCQTFYVRPLIAEEEPLPAHDNRQDTRSNNHYLLLSLLHSQFSTSSFSAISI